MREFNSDNEAELLELIRLGDHGAFKFIYKKHYRQLCYFAGSSYFIEKRVVEEIVVDSFLDVWKGRDGLRSLPHVKNLLYLAVRTGCIDYLRSMKRQTAHFSRFLEQAEQKDHFENAQIESDLICRIHEAVSQLPAECKKVFELLYIQDLKPQEVAVKLQISPSTVRSQKARAIELLKKILVGSILAVFFS